MDSDGELDIVEQAERTALEEGDDDEPQEVQREANEDDVEEVEADGNEEDETTRTIIKPKKVVRNPQPKLNADTLRGPRGLTALPPLFGKQTFKGKGHEEADLNVILKTYEYWCHRLFPKMRFDQCIEKIETLGHKKPVMTYVKRIRMGILDEEPAEPRAGAVSDDEVESTPQQQQQIESVEARFDNFAQQQQQQPKQMQLTEEQMEIIRVNKERAMKLRAERLRRIQEQAEAKLGASSVLPSQGEAGTSGIHDETTLKVTDSSYDKSQIKQTQKACANVTDFDDDDEFMTLSRQIPDNSGMTPQDFEDSAINYQNTDGNDEVVGVDDLLSELNKEEENVESDLHSASKTAESADVSDTAMDVDSTPAITSDMATEKGAENQSEGVIGVDDLLNNMDDAAS